MNTEYAQCMTLKPRQSFAFRVNGKGRLITFRSDQRFWVTSTQLTHAKGLVRIAREGRNMAHAYAFTVAQAGELFDVA